MLNNMPLEEIKNIIVPILKSYEVTKAGIFGSVARGEDTDDSDIDILVEIKSNYSLLKFIELKIKLEELLGRKVDLVEYDVIKPIIKNNILREEIALI